MGSGTFAAEAEALRQILRDKHVRASALAAYLEELPVAVLLADDAGYYVAANIAACQLTGYSQTELLSRSIRDLTAASEHPAHDRLWGAFARADDDRQHGLYAVRHKNGHTVTVRYEAYRDLAPGVHASFLTPQRRHDDV